MTAPQRINIVEWPIKRGETCRVSIENYKGTWLISLCKSLQSDDGELRPVSAYHLERSICLVWSRVWVKHWRQHASVFLPS